MRRPIRDEAIEKESMFWPVKLLNFFGTNSDAFISTLRTRFGLHVRSLALSLPLLAHSCSAKARASQKTLRKGAPRQASGMVGEYPSRNSPANISGPELICCYNLMNQKFLHSYKIFKKSAGTIKLRCAWETYFGGKEQNENSMIKNKSCIIYNSNSSFPQH